MLQLSLVMFGAQPSCGSAVRVPSVQVGSQLWVVSLPCHPVHDPLLGCACARPQSRVPARVVVLIVVVVAAVMVLAPRSPAQSASTADASLSVPGPAAVPPTLTPVSDLRVPPQVLEIRESVDEPFISRWVPARCAEVAAAVVDAGLPEWMTLVAWRESRCIASVSNRKRSTGDDSWGLFQINTLGSLWGEVRSRCGVSSREQLLDAGTNIVCASKLFSAYGYRPWHAGKYFS
jgi:hypothetical protein